SLLVARSSCAVASHSMVPKPIAGSILQAQPTFPTCWKTLTSTAREQCTARCASIQTPLHSRRTRLRHPLLHGRLQTSRIRCCSHSSTASLRNSCLSRALLIRRGRFFLSPLPARPASLSKTLPL